MGHIIIHNGAKITAMLCGFMVILTCKHPPLNLENLNLDSKTYIAYFSGWMGYLQCLGLTKFCLGFLLLLVGYIFYLNFFWHNTWFQQQKKFSFVDPHIINFLVN